MNSFEAPVCTRASCSGDSRVTAGAVFSTTWTTRCVEEHLDTTGSHTVRLMLRLPGDPHLVVNSDSSPCHGSPTDPTRALQL